MRLRITRAADGDVFEILEWTEATFGSTARHRYELLIARAIRDVLAATVADSLSQSVISGGVDVHLWHLRRSRRPLSDDDVKNPRHNLVVRVEGGVLFVGRVLHEVQDLDLHARPSIW